MEALVHTASPTLPYGSVTRWRRFGNDRLYVRSRYGADLGWWDLATDEGHLTTHTVRRQSRRSSVTGRSEDVPPHRPPARFPPSSPPRSPPPRPGHGAPLGSPRPYGLVAAPADLLANRAGEQAMRREAAGPQPASRRTSFRRPRACRVGLERRRRRRAPRRRRNRLAGLDPVGLHQLDPRQRQGTDIDHLVIGPGGVFTINTKHHRDANIWSPGTCSW